MRYGSISGVSYQDNMPVINKPTHFDILSSQQIADELGQNQALPIQIKQTLTLDFINKKFPNDDFAKEYNKAIITLDPLYGKSIDDKLTAVSSGWVTKQDAILSENISKFILKSYEQNNDFFELSYTDKLILLYAQVDEQMNAQKIVAISLIDGSGNSQ